jgi:sugar phosphate isomerase/epimerase
MRIKNISFTAFLIISLALLAGCKCPFAATDGKMGVPKQFQQNGFAIGCQAYTFRMFTAFEAIEKTAEAGGKVIEFYPKQKFSKDDATVWDHNASDEMIARMKAKLKQHGIFAANYGVVNIPKNEDEARKIFVFARKMGMIGVTTESVDSIDTIEKLVKEFDIKVGFHDHPKKANDPSYRLWDPNYILELVKDRDHRIGACADTGHWVRSGLKPVDCLKILKGRIVSSHLKDLNEFGKVEAHDVPYGQGVSEIAAILDEFKAQKMSGNISVEYEYNWENSVPEVKQCITFVRNHGGKK